MKSEQNGKFIFYKHFSKNDVLEKALFMYNKI